METKLYKAFLVIIFLATVLSSYSQKKKIPAHIITNEGDSLNGFVQYASQKQMQKNIHFSISEQGPFTKYEAGQLDLFYLDNDELYISKAISYRSTLNLESGIQFYAKEDADTVRQKVFLKQIIAGIASLYSYIDQEGKEHFFIEKDTAFLELYQKQYYKNYQDVVYTQRGLVTEKQYIGILQMLMQDCEIMYDRINSLPFTIKALAGIVADYHKCITGEDARIFMLSSDLNTRFFVFAGMTSSRLSFKGETSDYLTKADSKSFTKIHAGFWADFNFPRLSKNIHLRCGLEYMESEYQSDYSKEDYILTQYWETEIGISSIRLFLGPSYNFHINKLTLFMEAGLFNNFIHEKRNFTRHTSEYPSYTSVEEGKALKSVVGQSGIKALSQGIFGGAGISYSIKPKLDIFLDVRYSHDNGISEINTIGSNINSLELKAGIIF